jgi:dTDP-4-amino-4,6-dideoxygalactose transaminase
MRIGRTLPPAAAPIDAIDLCFGVQGLLDPRRARARFEDELRRSFQVRHVFTLSSGAAALTLTLKALASTSDRREVVLPAYTCFTVPAAVEQAGLEPRLCDINSTTFDLDAERLDRLVGDRTLCVIAHHLFGIPSDIDRVRAICAARGAFVVEDAAQAMGADINKRMLGTLGDVGIFSLGRGKHVTCGEGGVIVTNDDRLAAAIDRHYRDVPPARVSDSLISLIKLAIMSACIRPWLYWIPASLPFLRLGETIYPTTIVTRRLSGMQAGVMRRMRLRLQRARRTRMTTAVEFTRRLQLGSRGTQAYSYLRLPVYAATIAQKQRLLAASRRDGLGLASGYPTPVNEIPELRDRFVGQRFAEAKRVAEHLLTIPTHHWLTARDMGAIVDQVTGMVSTAVPPETTIEPQVIDRDPRVGRAGFQMATPGMEREGA